ncbi:MAG: trigger factor [Candidatus Baumannia cicadellinicola]|nr:trigger factor [Candidatus Baumannia cicadellinicola]
MKIASHIIEETISKKLLELAKTVVIDGFRKGKAPIHIVAKRYHNYLCQDVLYQLMHQQFIAAMLKEKINVISTPNYTYSTYQKDKDLIYQVEFEISPQVELKGIDTITVEKPLVQIKETDIDAMLTQLIKQNGSWEKTNNAAKITDRVTIDLYGTIENKRLKGSQAKNLNFTIGINNKHIIPGLENGIIGHKAGDNFNINIYLPDEYFPLELRGKLAIFTVALKKVEQYRLPHLDESFIKLLGVVDGTVEGLRNKIRKDIEVLLKNAVRNYIKEQVINYLLSVNNIDVPDIMIEQEIQIIKQKNTKHIGRIRKSALEQSRELIEAQAKRRIQITLLLIEIIKQHDIKVNTARMRAIMEEMAYLSPQKQEIINSYNSQSSMRRQISNIVLEEQAIEALLMKANVIEKK